MGEMTKGEAIKYGTEWLKDEYLDAKDRAFIKIALEALEQEPSGDLISREETLTAFADYVGSGMSMNDYDALWNIVEKMPSVKQEPKTGHWIDTGSESFEFYRVYKCSECGNTEIEYPERICRQFRYCPNCGAKMESEE